MSDSGVAGGLATCSGPDRLGERPDDLVDLGLLHAWDHWEGQRLPLRSGRVREVTRSVTEVGERRMGMHGVRAECRLDTPSPHACDNAIPIDLVIEHQHE